MGAGLALNNKTLETKVGVLLNRYADRNGIISKANVIQATKDSLSWCVPETPVCNKVNANFSKLDTNGSGSLEPGEIAALAFQYGLTLEQACNMTVGELCEHIENYNKPKEKRTAPVTIAEQKQQANDVINNYWETMSTLPTKW